MMVNFRRGKEPTFFMHHNREKPYHIDYCFSSRDFEVGDVEVGDFGDWIKKSDQVPIIITLNDKTL